MPCQCYVLGELSCHVLQIDIGECVELSLIDNRRTLARQATRSRRLIRTIGRVQPLPQERANHGCPDQMSPHDLGVVSKLIPTPDQGRMPFSSRTPISTRRLLLHRAFDEQLLSSIVALCIVKACAYFGVLFLLHTLPYHPRVTTAHAQPPEQPTISTLP